MHYVPPLVRKKIIDALLPNLNPEPANQISLTKGEKRNLKINYQLLKDSARFDILKPCFKKYLFRQVRSSFLYIDPSEWEKAVLLPTERFQKASKNRVFKESMANASGVLSTVPNNKPTDVKPQKPTSNRTTSFFLPPEKK